MANLRLQWFPLLEFIKVLEPCWYSDSQFLIDWFIKKHPISYKQLFYRTFVAVIVQAKSGYSESEAMLGIIDDTEEKSHKDQAVTASKPFNPRLT